MMFLTTGVIKVKVSSSLKIEIILSVCAAVWLLMCGFINKTEALFFLQTNLRKGAELLDTDQMFRGSLGLKDIKVQLKV